MGQGPDVRTPCFDLRGVGVESEHSSLLGRADYLVVHRLPARPDPPSDGLKLALFLAELLPGCGPSSHGSHGIVVDAAALDIMVDADVRPSTLTENTRAKVRLQRSLALRRETRTRCSRHGVRSRRV